MFPWLRLLRTGMTLIGQPRVDLLATTTVRLRVWPNDLDVNMHVNNGRYLALADIGRIHWFARIGVLQLARRHRAYPVIGDAIAKFRRDLKLWQTFEVQTRLLGWDHRWAFVEHRFVRDGRVLGVVAIRGMFKGPSGPLDPGTLLAGLGVQRESPVLADWVVQWHSGCESLSESLRAEERDRGIAHRP